MDSSYNIIACGSIDNSSPVNPVAAMWSSTGALQWSNYYTLATTNSYSQACSLQPTGSFFVSFNFRSGTESYMIIGYKSNGAIYKVLGVSIYNEAWHYTSIFKDNGDLTAISLYTIISPYEMVIYNTFSYGSTY